MLEVVTVGALAAFLSAVGNGAAGEMGKQVLLSTGALARRTLGREVPLPAGPEGAGALARELRPFLGRDGRQAEEWALLVRSLPEATPAGLSAGPGLPPGTRDFTDREGVLRRLRREATRPAAGRPRVALLHGPPGIGTTAVALHWGATQLARYPDGQFYVDLRDSGAGTGGPEPAAVLARLLRQMGVGAEGVPATEARRERLYRELTAGRRALVVIDHASSVAQVRGLVPATPEVLLLVVASGPPFALEAERVAVPPLRDRDAVRLLRKVAGRENVARARPRLPELLDDCAGNAFALRAAAVHLLNGPPADGEPPVPGPGTGGHPVHGVARAACRRLRPEAARLCRLTALGGWPALDAPLAAAAADVAVEDAARMLTEAADVRLVEPLPDGRYRFRPEVRRYLADTAAVEHGVPECSAAVARVLERLLHRVLHAAHAALPESWRTEPAPTDAHSGAEGDVRGDTRNGAHGDADRCRGEAAGVAVLAAEVQNVAWAVCVAEEYQHPTTALRLARALWPLQLKAGHGDEVLPALRIAARCADDSQPDSPMAGALHFQLGHCLGALGRWEEAEAQARAAAACERAAGHLRGEASSVELLGLLLRDQWRYRAAYERFAEAERIYRRIGPGQEGADDLPRALALIRRHQGRALCGLGELEESRALLEGAVEFFAGRGEAYNQARALTDLAETLHAASRDAEALARIAEAERLLTPAATVHLRYLADLRRRCEAAG
ncbi:ATP-binding protein [Streptomyces sp. JJ66]|uniref:ATP-binding protein n=1 Tax=Streptomyces sp. JJ66 TaxID=2803843 RepID=UPI001C58731A|nr:ATP-binding protein [Streptomyces sp. JJ66]MBW1604471.1 ATP-binding protein [Streptomyces sp. JJ66]